MILHKITHRWHKRLQSCWMLLNHQFANIVVLEKVKNVPLRYKHRNCLFFAMNVHNTVKTLTKSTLDGFLEGYWEKLWEDFVEMLSLGDHSYFLLWNYEFPNISPRWVVNFRFLLSLTSLPHQLLILIIIFHFLSHVNFLPFTNLTPTRKNPSLLFLRQSNFLQSLQYPHNWPFMNDPLIWL